MHIHILYMCRRKYQLILDLFSLYVEYYFGKYIVFLYKYRKKMKTQLTDFFPFNKYDCKCIKQLHTAQLRSNKNTGTPYRLFLYKNCTVIKHFFIIINISLQK